MADAEPVHLFVVLEPLAARQARGQPLAVVFPHRIQVFVASLDPCDGDVRIAVVPAQDDRRLVLKARQRSACLDRWNDRVGKPVGLIVRAPQGFPQAHHEADVRILRHKLFDRFKAVIPDQRVDAVLHEAQTMFFSKGQRDVDVIEFQHQPDAAFVAFLRQPQKRLVVEPVFFFGDFQRLRILLKLLQRRERVSAPKIQHIRPVVKKPVEEDRPARLIVKPWKALRRDRVFIGAAGRLDRGLLESHAGAAELEHRRVVIQNLRRDALSFIDPLRESQAPVQCAGLAAADDDDSAGSALFDLKRLALGGFDVIEDVLALFQRFQCVGFAPHGYEDLIDRRRPVRDDDLSAVNNKFQRILYLLCAVAQAGVLKGDDQLHRFLQKGFESLQQSKRIWRLTAAATVFRYARSVPSTPFQCFSA